MRSAVGLYGELVETPAARAKNAKASNVHWLTPRMFRLWVNVGLRGHTAQDAIASGWVGRVEDRNGALHQVQMENRQLRQQLDEGATRIHRLHG